MDPEKPIEDQFSNLHPCLPVNTRIGIVGGGPSGLSAAYALAKLGYSNVTVIEKYHSVGGMCESFEIRGTENLTFYTHFVLLRYLTHVFYIYREDI